MPRTSQLLYPPDDVSGGTPVTDALVGLREGRLVSVTSHEAPFGELVLTGSDARHPHPLDWQSERFVPLLKNVSRLTAPNAGFLTGPGTNSYLLGEASAGFMVIDPGPDDSAHVQRLWQAAHDAGGAIRAIVCTHSHCDHAPGAWLLQTLCEQQGATPPPPVLGLPSVRGAPADSTFSPNRTLRENERLQLTGADGTTHTLRVVYTPGHAANHICLVLEEDALLFSGDHIMNGISTIVNPADGELTEYLDSLTKIDAVCARGGIYFTLPAHGYVLPNTREAIVNQTEYHLGREAKVLAALRADPQGNLDSWMLYAYGDTPSEAKEVVKVSLRSYVKRLRKLGMV
jgi:recombination protein RecT